MRVLLTAALVVTIISAAAGQDEFAKKVAVTDFQVDGLHAADSILISKRLVQSLTGVPGYEMVERETVRDKVIETKKTEVNFFESPAEVAKLGAGLGADVVIVGLASKTDSTFVLEVRTIDCSSGKVLSEYRVEHTGTIVDALGLADVLARIITGRYRGPVISTGALPEGRVGVPYSAELKLSPEKENVIWSGVDGSLPGGLQVDGDVITGTPEKPGVFRFTVRAGVKVSGLRGGIEKMLSIKIKPAPLTLPDMEMPVGRLGHEYDMQVVPPSGTPPFTWVEKAGSLPSGVSFVHSEGKVRGTPGVTGTFRIQVEVTDSIEPPETVSGWLTLKVTEEMELTTESLPTGYAGCAYKAKFTVENGLAPYKVEVTGSTGGFDIGGSGDGLEISGHVERTATFARVSIRASDSTVPARQEIEKTYEVKVRGLHVTPVVSYESVELYDIDADKGGNPMVLAAMKVLGAKDRWIAFCRWTGEDWAILPVTPEVHGGNYELLARPEGAPAVIGIIPVDGPEGMALSLFSPSEQQWEDETVATGRFHFLKARFRPDGELAFAYERDRKLWLIEKEGGAWKEKPVLDGVIELMEFLCVPPSKMCFLYQDASGRPTLFEMTKGASSKMELPDYPRCAGIDDKGRLMIFSYCLGESVCHAREKDKFTEVGRWKRRTSIGAVFSRRDAAAYSAVARSNSWSADRPAISCASAICNFDDITFDEKEFKARSYDSGSMKLAVDANGNVHAAFTASGVTGQQKKTLVYGRIATEDEFRKIAGAKAFVRLTSQKELAMPRQIGAMGEKAGSCRLAPDASPFSLCALLLLGLFYLRGRRSARI